MNTTPGSFNARPWSNPPSNSGKTTKTEPDHRASEVDLDQPRGREPSLDQVVVAR
jgi:hypothetical protein